MGLIAQLFREVKHQFSSLFSRFKKKPEENVEEVPAQWMKEKKVPGRALGKKRVVQKGNKFVLLKPTRRLYHWPWLRQLKRALAGILLIINLFIAEFILGTTPGALILFILFGANSLILIDYLWKTMKRKEQHE